MKNHLKRLATPRTWHIARKENVFITRPHASGHSLAFSLPLAVVLRDFLKFAKTAKEVRRILHEQEIFVDGCRRTDSRYAYGFLDVLSVPKLKLLYRLVLDQRGNLVPLLIDAKEGDLKICKIVQKKLLAGKKVQLCFHDGRTLLVQDSSQYHLWDSVLFNTKEKKIVQHFPFETGVLVYLVGGNHKGLLGTVQETLGEEFIFTTPTGERFRTLLEYALVVGKGKPAVSLQEKSHAIMLKND